MCFRVFTYNYHNTTYKHANTYCGSIPGCIVTEIEVAIPPSNIRVISTPPDSSTVYKDWSKRILTSVFVGIMNVCVGG